MPTSKQILDDAAKTLSKNAFDARDYKTIEDTMKDDTATFGKAKSMLYASIKSCQNTIDNFEDRLKELNAVHGDLRKQEKVMVAPADQKVFQKLLKDLEANIKGMTNGGAALTGMIKTAQGELKR